MELLFEETDIRAKNEMRLVGEIGSYHATEAIKIYNEAIKLYNRSEFIQIAQDKAIIMLKRAMPHLQECRRLNYKDQRLAQIITGMQLMMDSTHTNPLDPIKL